MLHRISTPILVAILLYHGYQYYQQQKLQKSVENYVKSNQKVKKVVDHKREKSGGSIIKVNDYIYVATGYALGNSIMMIGDDGVVIIDTTESFDKARIIAKEFRNITNKPVKGIIYSHNHVDHVMGTEAFLEQQENRKDVQIWAHHTFLDIWFHSIARVGKAHSFRSFHQFGVFLKDEQISAGLGTKLDIKTDLTQPLVPPNRFLRNDKQNIKIAGIELTLMHVPGETDDTICVYWPKQDALLGTDNLYKAFPNLYAIRGTPFRSLKLWYESLDKMRSLNPEFFVTSHHHPLVGKKNVYDVMTMYRDAVQLVHDQTVRFINDGLHPDEIAARIHLPKKLENNDYLKEIYGTIQWSSKGLFAGYMGWFSGDIAELDPMLPKERSQNIVNLAGGIDKLLIEAEKTLKQGSTKWALYLADAAYKARPDHSKAIEMRAKALIDMAELQTSFNGYNYYKTAAYKTLGTLEVPFSEISKNTIIDASTIPELFHLLSVRFMAEDETCNSMDKTLSFTFPDIREKFRFQVRNGVMDLSGIYSEKEDDITVTVDSTVWKAMIKGEWKFDIDVKPSIFEFKAVMNCISK